MKIYKLLTCIKNCKYINLYYLYIIYFYINILQYENIQSINMY